MAGTTTHSRLAYALDVGDIATFIEHLTAEAEYAQIITTLRLCHRFGTNLNDEAYITKLPVELVDIIEECLTEDKAAQGESDYCDERADAESCGNETCQPLDHLGHDWRSELVAEKVDELGLNPIGESDDEADEMAEEIVNKILSKAKSAKGRDHGWRAVHKNNATAWRKLVGKPGNDSHGLLAKSRAFMLERYGLDFFLAHTQTANDSKYKTTLYLLLPPAETPEAKSHTILKHNRSLTEQRRTGSAGVDALVQPIDVPRRPSREEYACFRQIFKALGLRPPQYFVRSGEDITTEEKENDGWDGKAFIRGGSRSRFVQPELKLLTRFTQS